MGALKTQRPRLQCTQIIRHIAELPDHLGMAEIARGRITREAATTPTWPLCAVQERLGHATIVQRNSNGSAPVE